MRVSSDLFLLGDFFGEDVRLQPAQHEGAEHLLQAVARRPAAVAEARLELVRIRKLARGEQVE